MAQEKILGNQLNIADCAAELSPSIPTDLITDTSPQLGADLDANGYVIRSADISSGSGVTLVIRAGNNSSSDNRDFAADLTITGGTATDAAAGGTATITGGASVSKSAGDAVLIGGYSSASEAGDASIIGGMTAAIDEKSAGNANVLGGVATGIATPGGDVVIRAGSSSASGGSPATAYGGKVEIFPGYGADGNGTVDIHAALTQISSRDGEGTLRIVRDDAGSLVGSVGLTVPDTQVAHVVFTLPGADGGNGDVLTTDGVGGLTFEAASGGGNWLIAHNGADFATAPIATGDNSIAIGNQATAYGNKSIAIGDVAQAGNLVGSPIEGDSIAIGNQSIAGGTYSVCVGGFARTAQGSYSSTAIGNSAYAEYAYATSVGAYCKAYATQQINVGYGVYGDATAKRATFGFGASNAPGVGTGQNLVTIYGDGRVEPIGDEAMFVAPTYTVATLPPVTAAGVIYVSDAGGSPATPTLCFCDGTSWISVLTGVTVV